MPTFTWRRSVGILEENCPLGSELVPMGPETEVLCHVLVPEHLIFCKKFDWTVASQFQAFQIKTPEEKMLVSPFAGDQLACQHQVGNPLFFSSQLLRCVKGIHLKVAKLKNWNWAEDILSAANLSEHRLICTFEYIVLFEDILSSVSCVELLELHKKLCGMSRVKTL